MLRWQAGLPALAQGRGGGRLIGIFVDDLQARGGRHSASAAIVAIATSSSSSSSSSLPSSSTALSFVSDVCRTSGSTGQTVGLHSSSSTNNRASSSLPDVIADRSIASFLRPLTCSTRAAGGAGAGAGEASDEEGKVHRSLSLLLRRAADRKNATWQGDHQSGGCRSLLLFSGRCFASPLRHQRLEGNSLLLRHRQFSHGRFSSSIAREDKEDASPTSGSGNEASAGVAEESTSSFWRTWIEKKLKESRSSASPSSSSSSVSLGTTQPAASGSSSSRSSAGANGVRDNRGPSIANEPILSSNARDDATWPSDMELQRVGIAAGAPGEEGGKLNPTGPLSAAAGGPYREKGFRHLPTNLESGLTEDGDGLRKVGAEERIGRGGDFVFDIIDDQILSQMTSPPSGHHQRKADGLSSLMSSYSGSSRGDDNALVGFRRRRVRSAVSGGEMVARRNERGDDDYYQDDNNDDDDEEEENDINGLDADIDLMDMDEHNIATLAVIPRETFEMDEAYQFRADRKFFPGQVYENEDMDVSIPPSHRPTVVTREGKRFTEKQALANADFRNVRFLQQFISGTGRLTPRRTFKLRAKVQRKIVREIKTSRALGLMPFQVLDGPPFRLARPERRELGHDID